MIFTSDIIHVLWDSVAGMNEVRLAIMKVEKQGYDDSLYSFLYFCVCLKFAIINVSKKRAYWFIHTVRCHEARGTNVPDL